MIGVQTDVLGCVCFFFFQAEDGIRDYDVTGVQTCALPIFESVIFGATGFSEMAKGAAQQPAIGMTPNFDSMHGIAVVRTKIPIDANKLNTGDEQTQTSTHEGQEYYLYPASGPTGTSISLFLPDSKTLVIGPEADLKAAIERGSKEERREDLDLDRKSVV